MCSVSTAHREWSVVPVNVEAMASANEDRKLLCTSRASSVRVLMKSLSEDASKRECCKQGWRSKINKVASTAGET